MGEGGEKKKASSLRGRVARSRKPYARKSNPMPMIIGLVVLALMGVGLFVFLGGPEEKKYKPPVGGDTSSSAPAGTTASSQPVRPQPKNLFEFLYYVGLDAKKDPDKALADLRANESKYGDFPDFHVAKAMAVDRKIGRTGDNATNRNLAQEKLRCLEKAQELLDDGKAWDQDPIGSKSANLQTSLEQCRIMVEKYSK